MEREREQAELNLTTEEKATRQSAHYLSEFEYACNQYLPKLTVAAHREEARRMVLDLTADTDIAEAA